MRARGLSLVLAVALAAVAGAEEAATDAERAAADEEIIVRGVRTGVLDPIPGASSDVLYTDDYTAENKTLGDLLSETEGVFVRRFGGAGDRSEVSIRGSSPSQVVVSIDGVRTNSALTGGLDLSRACLPLLERVEITRGAGSTREGSGAIGGVVNLVTRGASEPTTRAAFSGGAFDTYQGSALHADRIGALDYSLGYCGFGTEGDFEFVQPTEVGDGIVARFEPERTTRLNNDRVQHGATVGLGRELGPGTLRLTDYFVHSDGGEPGFDGGNGPTAGQSTEARSRDLSNLAQLRWEGSPPEVLGDELALSAYHRFERTTFEDPMVVFSDPIDVTARLSTLGARASDTWRFNPLGQELSARVLLDGAHDQLRASDQRGRERATGGAALEPTLRLFADRILLSAGARVDWADGFDPELLPSAGLVIEPVRWLRARGHAGRAYRVPNFDELFHPDEGFITGNPDLAPEDAWNFDAGLELELAEVGPVSDLRLGATWFRREIDESIVWLLVGPNTIRPENTGSATADGFELAGSLQLTRFVRFAIQHTRLDSRRDANRRRLPGQPEHETSGRVQLGLDPIWKLVGEGQHVGEILVNEGGSRRLPPRTVWNASAALNLAELRWLGLRRMASELWIHARVNNIGDVAVRDAVSFPQPGRHASAGFEVRW